MYMAGFHTKTFLKHDDYMTPKYAWENIQHFIPRDKVIWEAFYGGDGQSGKYLSDLQIIIPRKRIQFIKIVDGKVDNRNACNFDCFYYCWKMNLPYGINWLE